LHFSGVLFVVLYLLRNNKKHDCLTDSNTGGDIVNDVCRTSSSCNGGIINPHLLDCGAQKQPLSKTDKQQRDKETDITDGVKFSPEVLQHTSEAEKTSVNSIVNAINDARKTAQGDKVADSHNSESTHDHHHEGHEHEHDDEHHHTQGAAEEGKKKKTPAEMGETMIKYVCSKGDVEYHSAKDSEAGVRAHEQKHIEEYHEMAKKHGLMVLDESITINYENKSDLDGMTVSTGGLASARFAAEIVGEIVPVELGDDGSIKDSSITEKLEKQQNPGLQEMYI
jgi:hypothetical protein